MSVPPPSDTRALQRIVALVEIGRWEDAASAARALLVTEPASVEALCLLSQSLSAQRLFAGGLEAAQRVLALDPDSEWAHRLASIAYRGLSRPSLALTHAEAAVRLAPQLAQAHRAHSQALLDGGDLDGAARSALRGVELAPNDAASHRTVGIVAYQRDEVEAAEAAFRRALAIEPDDAVSHNELARIALKRSQRTPGGLARSARGFARALAADPRQSGSRKNLELVLRIFLARGAYFLFLAAWLSAIVASDDRALSRVIGVLLLVVPVGFTVRFLAALTPSLRSALVATIRADRVLTGAVGLELLTVAAVVVGALAEQPELSIGALIASLIVRAMVNSRRR
jgi:tetratricopeptide (TPR) repeat protein